MITAIQFILALSLLIVLHEGGHFLFAKLFKTRVEKFYLFFDFLFPFGNILPFSLFKKKVGETTYGIGWFPLGGYVKIAGMVDESMDKEQMKQPPQPWEFRSKPAWQRLLIMLGGIIVNVITAIVIYTFIAAIFGEKKLPMSEVNNKGGIEVTDSFGYKLGFMDGDKIISINNQPVIHFNTLFEQLIHAQTVNVERNGTSTTINMPENLIGQLVDNKNDRPFLFYPIPAIVGEVIKGSNAEKAGLKPDDILQSVNGTNTPTFTQFRKMLEANKGKDIVLNIKRNQQDMTINATVSNEGTLGFQNAGMSAAQLETMGYYQLDKKTYSAAEAIPAGVRLSVEKLESYWNQFKLFFNPKTEAYKGLGGFYSMSKIYGNTWDWERFWNVTAFLSIVLAFMNLLPIPGLDGGYVMFTMWEIVTGRKVGEKVMEVATTIGLVLLLLLMLYANGNDIFRNFFK